MNAKTTTPASLNRRSFLKTLAAGTAAAALPLSGGIAAAARKKPNVVVVLADDQGWGDLSVHGNTNLATPKIDSLARDGALFDRFYVCAVCAPTRAEFLTGRYHLRGGVLGVSTGQERLNPDVKTIADSFRAAGYATGAFGKWHNGSQYPYHPNARGFDEFYGFTSGHWGHYFDPVLEHNNNIVRGKGYIIDDLTNHALDFIDQNKERPFFAYLPYNIPHSPFQVPEKFYKKFKDVDLKMRNRDPQKEEILKTRCVLAMCENIDWNVGRVMAKLEDLDLAENTIFVYFSDNGPNSWRWNDGMKGKKGSVDEGGVRAPCLVRWPGHIPGGRKIMPIAGAIDLLPTLADLAGIEPIEIKPFDGVSLKPLLLGKTKTADARMIFSHQRGKVSVRTQRYRLDNDGLLYDMKTDPGQNKDISKDEPEIAARLQKAVKKWKAEVMPESLHDDRPFPIGHAEMPKAYLPARDGVAHGNVQRSGKAPNCSFFKNWTSKDDKITWDVESATAGSYRAVIYYSCTAENVGSTIEMSFAGKTLKKKITEAFDTPLRGAESDRAARGSESYVKDWKTLDLGTINLPKTRDLLTLRALDIPGEGVVDVRAVTMTLQ